MGCGASVDAAPEVSGGGGDTRGNDQGKMSQVVPSQVAPPAAGGRDRASSGAEQKMQAELVMKRKRAKNIRGKRVDISKQGAEEIQVVPKSDEARARLRNTLANHWLFETCEASQLDTVIDVMQPRSIESGVNIIQQNDDKAVEFYVIESGMCSVSVDGKRLEHTLKDGDAFGELALFYECPRSATVTAQTPVSLWVLDLQTFRMALATRNEEMIKQNISFLQQMPTFAETDSNQIAKFAAALGRMNFTDGAYVVKQGDVGEVFYIVVKGECRVVENDVEKEHRMKPGDWFGERALITDEVRSASIIAVGDVECVGMSRSDFVSFLGDFEGFRNMKKGTLDLANRPANAEIQAARKMKLSDLKPGTVLGVGGFGLVSLVTDRQSGNPYALKKMQKQRIAEADMQSMVVNEKNFLAELSSPFVLNLVGTTQDKNNVYLVLEFLQGGDLFGLLEKKGCFTESESAFYMACTALALEHVHSHSIAFRDLKLENLVLDGDGFLKLVDFGLAKRVTTRTYTVCGSPRYCAPEIVTGRGHCHFVDWWAMGVTLFECLFASSPFAADDDQGDGLATFRKIANGKLNFPRRNSASSSAKSFIRGLLDKKQENRLGCRDGGSREVRNHSFLKSVDFGKLEQRQLTPPYVPDIAGTADTTEFGEVDIYPEHLDELEYEENFDPEAGWTDEF